MSSQRERRSTLIKEYAIRFAFGGAVTVATGLVTQAFGPTVGGLFLAFPAILPASLTLISEHEGKQAARRDAAGAIAGSVGLIAFALVVWIAGRRIAPWQTLASGSLAWLAVSVGVWRLAGGHRQPSE